MGDHVCPWWLAYTFDNPIRTFFHKPDQIFSKYLKEGMIVADIGCGMGYFSIGLAKIVKQSGKVIAVDIQKKMLDLQSRMNPKLLLVMQYCLKKPECPVLCMGRNDH